MPPETRADPLPACPAPFRFKTSSGWLRCPSYGLGFRLLTVLIWLGLLGWSLRLDLTRGQGTWMLAALALMAVMAWHILRGRTELDDLALRQSWIWRKETLLADLAYVRLIRLPGLETLFAPRLYVRTLQGKTAIYYACEPRMLEEFGRLQRELACWNQDLLRRH